MCLWSANALNNWHSDIRKIGHHAVTEHRKYILKNNAETCMQYVSDALGEWCFVYGEPDAEVRRNSLSRPLLRYTKAHTNCLGQSSTILLRPHFEGICSTRL